MRQAEMAMQQKEVVKTARELQEKIKEVEARGKWLAEHKQLLLEREEQLRKLNADIQVGARLARVLPTRSIKAHC